MPNIKIYGLTLEGAGKLIDDIISAIEKLPFADDAVITTVLSTCVDIKKRPQPFLRILSSEEGHFEPLIEALAPLGLDMEEADLRKFHPKKVVVITGKEYVKLPILDPGAVCESFEHCQQEILQESPIKCKIIFAQSWEGMRIIVEMLGSQKAEYVNRNVVLQLLEDTKSRFGRGILLNEQAVGSLVLEPKDVLKIRPATHFLKPLVK